MSRVEEKRKYGAIIVRSICEAHAADRRLTIKELIERFDMGYGTMHRVLTEDLQMSKVILSYKFDFYMMHVAKVSDHSYSIVYRNNQFKGTSNSYKPDCRTVWIAVVRGQWIHRHRRCVECEGFYFEKN